MPLLADRVRETTTTTGQGTLTLDGAPSGFRTFTGAFGNGASVYYVIAGPSEWEIGFGTTGAGTLTRDTVLVSSAGGTTKVTFSAGTKDVFCSYVADRAVTTSDAATLTNKTIDDYTNNVGANSTHFRIKASGTLAKGTVVKAVGFTPGEQAIEVAATSSASDVALGISEQALTTGQFGMAVVIGELFDVNTNGLAVGATLYSDNAGSYTTTKPSSGFYQSLGWVVRANLNNGVIAVNVVAPLYVETSTNTANTSVLRDGSGNFAAGTITAALTGNASTATALQTARTINGVSFNGTADITVTAAAGTLSGTTLASSVVNSSLTSVGTLTSLTVSADATLNGVRVGRGASNVATNTVVGNGAFNNASNTSLYNTVIGVSAGASINTSGDARNTLVGALTGFAITTGTNNTFVGMQSAQAMTTGFNNTGLGLSALGSATTGRENTGIGYSAGSAITTGSKNTLLGAYNGNQDGIDIRTANNNIVLSDGDGNARLYYDGASNFWAFRNGGTERWRINSAGHLLAGADATYDIGASGATRPRNYFGSGTLTVGGAATADSVQSVKCVSVGNATPSTSGAGITFPATQSASSDANTLDDYEEGTWTPTQGAGITLVGTFSSAGNYTKVGRLVHAYGYVAGSTSVALATAGSVVCAGLPFTAPAAEGQMGVLGNNATTASSALQVSSATIYNNETIAATSKIFITVSYYV